MMLRIGLALLVACCAGETARAQVSRSSASLVALGTATAVLDVVEADLRGRDCFAVTRGRDSTGADGINVEETCPGRYNVATIRASRVGSGRVRVTTQSAFVMGDAQAFTNLPTVAPAALYAARVPAVTEPVEEPGGSPCSNLTDERLVDLAGRFAVLPDSAASPASEAAETPPELVRGFDAFVRSIRYPDEARRADAEGKTFVQFVVDAQGRVSCAAVIVALNAEALRAVRAARYRPGTQNGQPVNVRMTLPITFDIN